MLKNIQILKQSEKLESLVKLGGVFPELPTIFGVRKWLEWSFDTLQSLQLVSGFLLNRQQAERS